MSLKLKLETSFDNLMNEDASVVIEFACLASNIKKEVVEILDFVLSFLRKYERKKISLYVLMLDLKFKNIHLVASLSDLEQGKAIVNEYNTKPLYPMHLKCYFQWREKHEIMFLLLNFFLAIF